MREDVLHCLVQQISIRSRCSNHGNANSVFHSELKPLSNRDNAICNLYFKCNEAITQLLRMHKVILLLRIIFAQGELSVTVLQTNFFVY